MKFSLCDTLKSQSLNMSPVTQSSTQKNEEDIEPNSFRKQKLQSISLNTLMENPGFLQITEKILLHLDHEYRLQISRISISREKREILSHFSVRNEKKPIKILLYKMDIIVVWIWQRLQWSYFLLEKLKPSLFYYIFTCLI